MKKITSFLILLLLSPVLLISHFVHNPIIIDTDVGMDDIRALIIMLNNNVYIKAIVTSDGSTAPLQGAVIISDVIKRFGNNISIGMGRELNQSAPPWRENIYNVFNPILNAYNSDSVMYKDAVALLSDTIRSSGHPVDYICLGPMTNLMTLLKNNPGLKGRISRVMFYGTPPGIQGGDWNRERDEEAYRYVTGSGLKVYFFKDETNLLDMDKEFLGEIKNVQSYATEQFADTQAMILDGGTAAQSHQMIWDEIIALYYLSPGDFVFTPDPGNKALMIMGTIDKKSIEKNYIFYLKNPRDRNLEIRDNVVFEEFPSSPGLFKDFVGEYALDIQERHGFEEWKAAVLTNEFHRHLGLYSIIGCKMGIRARELLGSPFDELDVVVSTGLEPPLSCLIDGIQVSTGASLGRGKINVGKGVVKPEVEFMYKNKKLSLRLKTSVIKMIDDNIRILSREYGFSTPEYYEKLARFSVRFWLDLDRKDIFIEKMIH